VTKLEPGSPVGTLQKHRFHSQRQTKTSFEDKESFEEAINCLSFGLNVLDYNRTFSKEKWHAVPSRTTPLGNSLEAGFEQVLVLNGLSQSRSSGFQLKETPTSPILGSIVGTPVENAKAMSQEALSTSCMVAASKIKHKPGASVSSSTGGDRGDSKDSETQIAYQELRYVTASNVGCDSPILLEGEGLAVTVVNGNATDNTRRSKSAIFEGIDTTAGIPSAVAPQEFLDKPPVQPPVLLPALGGSDISFVDKLRSALQPLVAANASNQRPSVQSLSLSITRDSFGPIEVEIKLEGGVISVRMRAAADTSLRKTDGAISELAGALKQLGFEQANVSIEWVTSMQNEMHASHARDNPEQDNRTENRLMQPDDDNSSARQREANERHHDKDHQANFQKMDPRQGLAGHRAAPGIYL
jgi:hypothetical protein